VAVGTSTAGVLVAVAVSVGVVSALSTPPERDLNIPLSWDATAPMAANDARVRAIAAATMGFLTIIPSMLPKGLRRQRRHSRV
jgi:hypothetical protein